MAKVTYEFDLDDDGLVHFQNCDRYYFALDRIYAVAANYKDPIVALQNIKEISRMVHGYP